MVHHIETVFDIGDRVYHNTPESLPGIVIDISYSFYADRTSYLISTGFGQECWCQVNEISKEKIII